MRILLFILCVLASSPTLAQGKAERIAAVIRTSHHILYGDAVPPAITVEGCRLTIDATLDPGAFGSIQRLDLGALELAEPFFVHEMSPDITRLDLKEGPGARRAMAPALWRLMGGSDADRPSDDIVLARSVLWDPLGMANGADPSMMTPDQQAGHDRDWARALDGEGGDALAWNHSEWWGPELEGRRGVWHIPGTLIQIGLLADTVGETLSLFRAYVAETCPE